MNVQRVNFQDILRFYFERNTTATATKILGQMIACREHLQLANLLRDHRDRSVYSKRERYLRACVDDLLLCCNILEIATLTQFILGPDDSPFWRRIQVILENKQVRRYMEEFYPVKLPQLLTLRLQQRYWQIEPDDGTVANIVVQFLALDQEFMSTLNNSYLLLMLDSFTIRGYRFRDVVELIDRPEIFVKRILLPPSERTVPDFVLQELSRFFQFSINLDELLRRMNRYPLIQSELWNHYSYWFEQIGSNVNRKLGIALDQFVHWKPINSDDNATREIQEYIGRARLVVDTLTSRQYAGPVEAALQANQ